MSIDIDKERDHFEAYVRTLKPTMLFIGRFLDGDYKNGSVQNAWQVWLAAKRHAAEVAAPSGASVEGDARDAARMSYMRAKHVMGASYGGMVTLSVIVRSDDYAMGGIDWALDCQTEAIAAMSPNKEG